MARVEIPEVVTRVGFSDLFLRVVPGARVQVNVRGGGAANVWDSEVGGALRPNPLATDDEGRIEGWLEEGSYDLVVTGDGVDYTQRIEAFAAGPSGTLALRSRLGLNLKDFGAPGDGSIQTMKWIDMLAAVGAAGGADCVVPRGTYVLDLDSTLPANTHLILEDGAVIKSDNTVLGLAGSRVSGGYWTTRTAMVKNAAGFQPYPTPIPNPTGYTALRNYIHFQNATNCHADHLSGDGLVVEFDNVVGFSIEACEYKGGFSVMGGLQTFNGSHDGRVIGNNISFSSASGFGFHNSHGILCEGNHSSANGQTGFAAYGDSDQIDYVDNEAYGHTIYDGFDINPTAQPFSTPRSFKLLGNRSHDNAATGFNVMCSGVTISGNHAYKNGTNGIRVTRELGDVTVGKGCVVALNHVYNNNTSNTPGTHNIVVAAMQRALVIGNESYWTAGAAFSGDRAIYVDGRNCLVALNSAWNDKNPGDATNLISVVNTTLGGQNMKFGNIGATADLPDWTDLAPLNGWATLAGFSNAGYWLDPAGVLHLRGKIQGGVAAAGTVLLNIPATDAQGRNLRPAARQDYPVVAQDGTAIGAVRVAANGDVTILLGGNAGLALDSVSYRPV